MTEQGMEESKCGTTEDTMEVGFKSIIVPFFDMHRSYLASNAPDKIKKETKETINPAGLTSKPDSLALTISQSLKSNLLKNLEDWVINKYEKIKRTKSDNMKATD